MTHLVAKYKQLNVDAFQVVRNLFCLIFHKKQSWLHDCQNWSRFVGETSHLLKNSNKPPIVKIILSQSTKQDEIPLAELETSETLVGMINIEQHETIPAVELQQQPALTATSEPEVQQELPPEQDSAPAEPMEQVEEPAPTCEQHRYMPSVLELAPLTSKYRVKCAKPKHSKPFVPREQVVSKMNTYFACIFASK